MKSFVDSALGGEERATITKHPSEQVFRIKGENTVQLEQLGYKMESEDKNSCGIQFTVSPPEIFTSGIPSKRISKEFENLNITTSSKVVRPIQASFMNHETQGKV